MKTRRYVKLDHILAFLHFLCFCNNFIILINRYDSLLIGNLSQSISRLRKGIYLGAGKISRSNWCDFDAFLCRTPSSTDTKRVITKLDIAHNNNNNIHEKDRNIWCFIFLKRKMYKRWKGERRVQNVIGISVSGVRVEGVNAIFVNICQHFHDQI